MVIAEHGEPRGHPGLRHRLRHAHFRAVRWRDAVTLQTHLGKGMATRQHGSSGAPGWNRGGRGRRCRRACGIGEREPPIAPSSRRLRGLILYLMVRVRFMFSICRDSRGRFCPVVLYLKRPETIPDSREWRDDTGLQKRGAWVSGRTDLDPIEGCCLVISCQTPTPLCQTGYYTALECNPRRPRRSPRPSRTRRALGRGGAPTALESVPSHSPPRPSTSDSSRPTALASSPAPPTAGAQCSG